MILLELLNENKNIMAFPQLLYAEREEQVAEPENIKKMIVVQAEKTVFS